MTECGGNVGAPHAPGQPDVYGAVLVFLVCLDLQMQGFKYPWRGVPIPDGDADAIPKKAACQFAEIESGLVLAHGREELDLCRASHSLTIPVRR